MLRLHPLSSAAEAGSCSERLTLNPRNTRPIAGQPVDFHPYHGRSGWLKELAPPEIAALWSALPSPVLRLSVQPKQLNYFTITAKWLERRRRDMSREVTAILSVLGGSDRGVTKIKCSRYLPSLRESLSRESDLGPWLRRYAEIASLDVG